MELATILFEFDSHRLTTDSQQLLKNNAEQLLENTEARATIEGHCDERGSDGYNLALGERRAVAAKNYLAGLGISPERLAVISYGEERPASSGHTEIDWQQNRRVEFKKRY
jgi:peptidoglycan-associated lipoprotein